MKQLLINFFKTISPTYRVLDKSFFELNKRIDSLEYTLANKNKVDYILSKNQGLNLLAEQIFETNNFKIHLKYNIFNFHDFSSIVDEIIKPNFYTHNSKATYFWGDMNFEEGDVVIDIGGNIGMFSIPFAKSFPHVRVICFEPLKQNYDVLKLNVELNQLKNVEIYQFGVSGEPSLLNFVWKPFHNGGSGGIDLTSKGDEANTIVNELGEITPVELLAFDSLFNKFQFKKIALLKMDCEGGEYDIMLKSKLFNSKHISHIIGEVHEDTKLGSDFRKINNLLNNEFSGKFRMDCYQDLLKKYNVEK